MAAPIRLKSLIAACLALTGPALADPVGATPLGSGLPRPGASLDDARTHPLADGQRLVCDSDTDKPRLANPALLRPRKTRDDHVRLCSVFVAEGETWRQAEVGTAFGPARPWLTFVEIGSPGHYRLAQVSLWGRNADWDKAAGQLRDMLGEPTTRADHFLGWQDAQNETMMFNDERHPDEFAVAVADIRLRKLLKSPGAAFRE